jgi:hypothetical protein
MYKVIIFQITSFKIFKTNFIVSFTQSKFFYSFIELIFIIVDKTAKELLLCQIFSVLSFKNCY